MLTNIMCFFLCEREDCWRQAEPPEVLSPTQFQAHTKAKKRIYIKTERKKYISFGWNEEKKRNANICIYVSSQRWRGSHGILYFSFHFSSIYVYVYIVVYIVVQTVLFCFSRTYPGGC